ncbi:MAG: hypothetical protein NC831_06040 [Candidatus Omnitrophica bacterium]|nr:hypothetical protein [Candidatus Omnitrophota bacterium]MCM8828086.1 hypothetical protein [Candidatus Omnitrophota bacterium]
MLKLTRKGRKITVETGSGSITWDADKGGEIIDFACKNEKESHKLLSDDATISGLKFVIGGQAYKLSETKADLKIESIDKDRIVITNQACLARGFIKIIQTYQVHQEGAVFCEQVIETEGKNSFTLSEISMNILLDVGSAKSARWGYFTREPWYKRDYSTTHVFYGMDLYKNLDDISCHRELWPLASIDLGWANTKFFSNKIEFVLDEWVSFNDAPRQYTMSYGGRSGKKWVLKWYILQGMQMTVSQPSRYRNKWGMFFLTSRTQNEKGSDAALKNNVLGCRVAHCMYPYAQIEKDWPWVVMPVKQVACQPPQLFKGNPDIKRVDEAADAGANLMIIHQFWMRNPGTNCEPPADYVVKDPQWFKAFVDRCHRRGMRVLTYIRGCEQYQMYQSWFEDYMQRDWDGLYPDWNSPHAMGFTKTSLLHWSSYAYFMYLKAMRKRVGEYGAIIGHTGFPFALTQSCIDVALCGELSIKHDELLTVPESTAYFSCLDCSGAHLIGGNLKDRAEFSGKKAAAICSAFGMTGHPVLEPGVPFEKAAAYIKPLWDAMTSLPGRVVKLHNPAYCPTDAVYCKEFWLFPSLWQSDQGKCLLLVTNLSDNEKKSGDVLIDTGKLDLSKNAGMRILKIKGTCFHSATIKDNIVKIKDLPPHSFCAIIIG